MGYCLEMCCINGIWAVKMCPYLLEMGCRDGLLHVNGLYMCATGWTYAVEMGTVRICVVKIGCKLVTGCKDGVLSGNEL